MKNSLTRLCALVLLSAAYYLFLTGYKPTENVSNQVNVSKSYKIYTGPVSKTFTNCIFNQDYYGMGTNSGASWSIKKHLPNYKYSLNFNAIHIYGGDQGGTFNAALSTYKDNVNTLMGCVDTSGLKGFYGRQKIEKLCYGQRVIYEAEGGNNGFSYSTRTGTTTTDGGRTVVRACIGGCGGTDGTPRMLLEDIYENIQHSDVLDAGYYGDPGLWVMKPVMKIDSSIVDSHPDWPVVTIQVFKFGSSETPIKTVEIRAEHFAQNFGGNIYGGEYIDTYNFIEDPQFDITISGSTADGLNEDWSWYTENSNVDFKIYWHGQVDVWFDKMTVDDEMGDELFRGIHDTKVTDEVNEFFVNNSHASLYTFFADEILYSNIPCVKRVQELIKDVNTNATLVCATTNYHNTRGLRDDDIFYPYFFSQLNPERFQADIHELGVNHLPEKYGRVPDNLESAPDQDPMVPSQWYITKSAYNQWLQDSSFGDKTTVHGGDYSRGSYIYQLRLARDEANEYVAGIRFIAQPQIHAFVYDENKDDEYDYGLREPTNEEIQAQAMIALAHGADALCWFTYQSWSANEPILERLHGAGMTSDPLQERRLYCLGMLELLTATNTDPDLRILNMWGQDKASYVSAMNQKLLNWKSTLEALTWQNGYSVHNEGANHEWVYDIKSIDPDVSGYNSECYEDIYTYEDCDDESYWEMGFFQPTGLARYFLMVNRRCVPPVDTNIGDVRVLKIKFDADGLPIFTTWKITEVGGSSIGGGVTFNKNSNTYVDLVSTNGGMGWFKPGEGKLFKLEPVMKSGGTLLADEVISGQSYTCEDTVLNGGYNITFSGTGNTVQFSDSATIIMSGGTFKTSDSVTQSSNKNTFKAAVSGHTWGGLRFTGTNVKLYNSKFENISSPCVNYAVKMLNCPFGDIRNNIFTLNTDTAGAVQSVWPGGSLATFYGFFANYNTITMNNSRGTGISVQGFSGLTIPIYAMNNTMTSNGYATGIMLSTITGGGVKKNSITGFSTGINALGTGCDIFNNTISNTSAVSNGITALSSTTVNLAPVSGLWLGGFNTITNTYGSSYNIEVDNSVFTLDGGKNTLNITDAAEPEAQHLYGEFWEDSYPGNQTENCFKLNGTAITSPDPPYEYITDGTTELSLTYTSYLCGGSLPSNSI